MGKFFIHKSSFLDSSSKVGAGTKIWHFCNVLSNVIIGENCVLGQNIFIGRNVFIGNNVKIQNNVSIYDGIYCQDDVFIGPSVVFTNVINPRSFIESKVEFKKTELTYYEIKKRIVYIHRWLRFKKITTSRLFLASPLRKKTNWIGIL